MPRHLAGSVTLNKRFGKWVYLWWENGASRYARRRQQISTNPGCGRGFELSSSGGKYQGQAITGECCGSKTSLSSWRGTTALMHRQNRSIRPCFSLATFSSQTLLPSRQRNGKFANFTMHSKSGGSKEVRSNDGYARSCGRLAEVSFG